ncbi:MAG: hypothetical protein ABFS32_07530 [Bacteroidota bacterium]
MPVVITDNKLCHSIFDEEHKILRTKYHGLVNKELYIEHLDKLKTLENPIIGSIADFRKLRGSYFKHFNFLEEDAFPAVKMKGFKYVAYLISDDLIIENVTHKLVEILRKLNIEAKIFTDPEEAESWLLRKL